MFLNPYFLRAGGHIFALQYEMGHSDLSTTRKYINLAQKDVEEQHSIASPVNKFVKRTTRINKIFKGKEI
jgi:site-specific recombinase XerC